MECNHTGEDIVGSTVAGLVLFSLFPASLHTIFSTFLQVFASLLLSFR